MSVSRVGWHIALAVIVLVLIIAGFITKTALEGHRSLVEGRAALQAGDAPAAVLALRHAVECYVPLAQFDDDALSALIDIGIEREQANDRGLAIFAYSSARAAVLSIRHFAQPHAAEFVQLERRLAVALAGGSGNAAATSYISLLANARTKATTSRTGAAAAFIFIGWCGSLFVIAWLFAPSGERPRRTTLAACILGSVFLFVGWILLVVAA